MAESVFRGTIDFFYQLGIYDVILPFLLTFTVVFAILEKTKIYGTEKVGDTHYSKKNLNAMTAFVMAFFVVASTRLVAIIHEVAANVVLLLFLSVAFMMLVGSFKTGEREFQLSDGWAKFLAVLMFIGIVLIFLNAMGWLDWLLSGIVGIFTGFDSVSISSIVMIAVIVGFIFYITKGEGKPKEKKKES